MHPTVVAFRTAVEAHDLDAVMSLMAAEPTLSSPTLHRPFVGAVRVRAVLAAVMQTIEDLHYVDALDGGSTGALVFRGHVGTKALQGVDLFVLDDDGRITDLTVLVRPLSGLVALKEAMTVALGPG